MLLEILMGFQCWRWTWSPLKRNPGGSQVCVCVCVCSKKIKTQKKHLQHVWWHWQVGSSLYEQYFTSGIFVCVCAGADLSDYFNYGFNEDTWKAYCEKQKRLRMGLEVSTVGSVTSKITVRDCCSCCPCFFLFLSPLPLQMHILLWLLWLSCRFSKAGQATRKICLVCLFTPRSQTSHLLSVCTSLLSVRSPGNTSAFIFTYWFIWE